MAFPTEYAGRVANGNTCPVCRKPIYDKPAGVGGRREQAHATELETGGSCAKLHNKLRIFLAELNRLTPYLSPEARRAFKRDMWSVLNSEFNVKNYVGDGFLPYVEPEE